MVLRKAHLPQTSSLKGVEERSRRRQENCQKCRATACDRSCLALHTPHSPKTSQDGPPRSNLGKSGEANASGGSQVYWNVLCGTCSSILAITMVVRMLIDCMAALVHRSTEVLGNVGTCDTVLGSMDMKAPMLQGGPIYIWMCIHPVKPRQHGARREAARCLRTGKGRHE